MAASTQNQALSALVFLYREVLGRTLELESFARAKRPRRLPVVLTRSEVRAVLEELEGTYRLMASLLYGAGLRVERKTDFHGWDKFTRAELAYAGVNYRKDIPADQFVRLRSGFDFTRGLDWSIADRKVELGLYAVFDIIVDPPTVLLDQSQQQPMQAEFGFTLATRPRYRIWKFDAPRLGFGYRLAGTLSAWRFVIGVPF